MPTDLALKRLDRMSEAHDKSVVAVETPDEDVVVVVVLRFLVPVVTDSQACVVISVSMLYITRREMLIDRNVMSQWTKFKRLFLITQHSHDDSQNRLMTQTAQAWPLSKAAQTHKMSAGQADDSNTPHATILTQQ